MSPYKWRPSNYLCPDCERRLQAKAGPDGLKAERCPDCDWSKVFDPNADEFPSQELDRVRFATDGGTSDSALPHTEETGETYAVVIHNKLPHCLFDDMDTAIEYVESHPRLSQEDGSTQVMWPLRARRMIDDDD